jgi:hypothetical protein
MEPESAMFTKAIQKCLCSGHTTKASESEAVAGQFTLVRAWVTKGPNAEHRGENVARNMGVTAEA